MLIGLVTTNCISCIACMSWLLDWACLVTCRSLLSVFNLVAVLISWLATKSVCMLFVLPSFLQSQRMMCSTRLCGISTVALAIVNWTHKVPKASLGCSVNIGWTRWFHHMVHQKVPWASPCLAFVNIVGTWIAWSHKVYLAWHYKLHILHCMSVLVSGLGLIAHLFLNVACFQLLLSWWVAIKSLCVLGVATLLAVTKDHGFNKALCAQHCCLGKLQLDSQGSHGITRLQLQHWVGTVVSS